MANLLLRRGYRVRIAVPKRSRSWRSRIVALTSFVSSGGGRTSGFLHQFKGSVSWFSTLDELQFQAREIVIAVGTYSVAFVKALSKPVIKVRFNHGFPAKPSASDEAAWTGRMPTITVSNTLVPKLQAMTEGSVWGVVPNGIETKDYFVEPGIERTGLGALFNGHPNKAPEDLIAVLQMMHARRPQVRQHVFGTERMPTKLQHVAYSRLPSVEEARRIYNRCRVWVLTSRTEGLPGVVLEAMACGCVVVSSDNDGSLEILKDGRNGLIAPRGNCNAIISQIDRLFDDMVLLESLRLGSAETIKLFTWERAADRMELFLIEMHRNTRASSDPLL